MLKKFIFIIDNPLLQLVGFIAWFLGGFDGLLIALTIEVLADYITGVFVAVENKQLSSKIGLKGIVKKVVMYIAVGAINILDVYVLGGTIALREIIIIFFIANETISLLENCSKLGIPIPKKIKDVLKQLRDNNDTGKVE